MELSPPRNSRFHKQPAIHNIVKELTCQSFQEGSMILFVFSIFIPVVS